MSASRPVRNPSVASTFRRGSAIRIVFSASAPECAAILDASTNPAHPGHAWYAGYVHESQSAFHVAVPAQGTCAGGTTPVYRLWNGQANAAAWGSNHRYTTSPAIVSQMVGEGYVNEGVVMCSPN